MQSFNLTDGGLLLFADPQGGLLQGTAGKTDVFVGSAGADTFALGQHGGDDMIVDFGAGDHIRLAAPPWSINWEDGADGMHITYWGTEHVTLFGYHGHIGPDTFIIGF